MCSGLLQPRQCQRDLVLAQIVCRELTVGVEALGVLGRLLAKGGFSGRNLRRAQERWRAMAQSPRIRDEVEERLRPLPVP